MIEIADLALRAVINFFEIYTINSSVTIFFSLKHVIECYEKMTHTNLKIFFEIFSDSNGRNCRFGTEGSYTFF